MPISYKLVNIPSLALYPQSPSPSKHSCITIPASSPALIAICLKEFHELGIPKEKILLNIGYYGDAEVSFSLDMNPNKIEDFQIY